MISRFKNRFWKCFAAKPRVSAFGGSSAGAVAVMTALTIPLLLGVTSLGIEVGHWYAGQRTMQGAADAAAISAAAQYIADYPTNPNNTTYQTVGVSYAGYNGFTIPTANVCLVTSSGNNCSTVLSLDSRALVCANPPCVVVEITQNTATWLTTRASLMPGASSIVQAIPTPTLMARAIVSMHESTLTTTTSGADCILALANKTNAVQVEGGGDLVAKCGVSIDGGLDQNHGSPVLGGITFNGANAKAEVTNLVVSANSPYSTECPVGSQGAHCLLYDPNKSPPAGTGSTTQLPTSDFFSNTATQDPYASAVATLFQTAPPAGVQTGGVAMKTPGSGYTGTSCTFTVSGGTYYSTTSSPATFTATISGGKVTAIVSVTDPGAYTTFPTSPVSASAIVTGSSPSKSCGGSGATFTLTEGCFTWNGTPIAGRKYCSIFMHGQDKPNFPAGNYWIAGGDVNCVGFCTSGSNVVVTSAVAGVTFFLTNGDGANSLGTNSYAQVSIQSGTVNLCSPGTNCGTTCSNKAGPTSCMLFIQNPNATLSTGLKTVNNLFNGNGKNTLSGLVYLPKQTFSTTGTSSIGGCFGVIAYYVDIGGTPEFSNGCLPGNGIGGTTTTTTTLANPFLYQ
jgi:Flp pilus assembly protein TadG